MLTRTSTLLIISIIISPLLAPTQSILADNPGPIVESAEKPPYISLDPVIDDEGFIIEDAYPRAIVIADDSKSSRTKNFPRQEDLELAAGSAGFVIDYVPAGGQDPWQVDCSDFPAEAKTAFEYAASIWAATVNSTIPISIRACWGDLGIGWLGYSGGGSMYRDFPGAPRSGTFYLSSLANALHGADMDTSRYDMYITYSDTHNYHFDLDADPPSNTYDFVTLALHEIGHGLNFSGWATYASGLGYLGNNENLPNIYDTFIRDGDGTPLTSYESPSANLGFALTSNNLWFHGSHAMAANGGSRVKIYAPATWKGGSSYSHLDYDTFSASINDLMVYKLSKGSANHDTGPITRGLLRDLGWPDRLEPYAPVVVWASDSTFADKVRISWIRPSSATYFELYRHTSNTTVGATHLTPDPSESPFDDIYAAPGTDYYYWIKACNNAGCSEYSAADIGTRGVFPVPDTPAVVSASDGAFTDMVRITWDEPASATYYKVYRDIDSSLAGAVLLATPVLGDYYDDTSPASILYYYWVKACNSAGCSSYSIPDSGFRAASGPSVPTGVAASDGTYKNKVEITWNPSTGGKNYQIFRNISDTIAGALLLQGDHTTTTYEDNNALPGKIYFYWVKACNSEVCSGFSNSDPGYITSTEPSSPSGVTASDGIYSHMVLVSWNTSQYATSYQVFRNTINNPSGAVELVNNHPANAFEDLFAIPGLTYYYWVAACNDEGCSVYSTSDSGYRGSEYFNYLPIQLK